MQRLRLARQLAVATNGRGGRTGVPSLQCVSRAPWLLAPVSFFLVAGIAADASRSCDTSPGWGAALMAYAVLQAVIAAMGAFGSAVITAYTSEEYSTSAAASRARGRLRRMCASPRVGLAVTVGVWLVLLVTGMEIVARAASAGCSTRLPFVYRVVYAVVYGQCVLLGGLVLMACCSCLSLTLYLAGMAPASDRALADFIESTQSRQAASSVHQGVSQATLDTLERSVYTASKSTLEQEDAACAVCIMPYEDGDDLVFLPCRHHFHDECVIPWLNQSRACPACRHDVEAGPRE